MKLLSLWYAMREIIIGDWYLCLFLFAVLLLALGCCLFIFAVLLLALGCCLFIFAVLLLALGCCLFIFAVLLLALGCCLFIFAVLLLALGCCLFIFAVLLLALGCCLFIFAVLLLALGCCLFIFAVLLLVLGCCLFICRVRNRSKTKSVDVGFTENVSYSMSSMKQWPPSPPPPPLKEVTTQNAMPLENAEEDHVYENPEMYHIYEMDDVTPDDDNMIANASYVPVGSTLKTLEAAHSPATTAKQAQDPHCKSAIVDVVGQGGPVTRRNLPKSQSPVENRYSANPRSSTCESKEMHKAAAAAQTDGVSAPTPGEGEVEYMTMSLVEGDGQVPNSTPPQ